MVSDLSSSNIRRVDEDQSWYGLADFYGWSLHKNLQGGMFYTNRWQVTDQRQSGARRLP